jgi:hypothetical protein
MKGRIGDALIETFSGKPKTVEKRRRGRDAGSNRAHAVIEPVGRGIFCRKLRQRWLALQQHDLELDETGGSAQADSSGARADVEQRAGPARGSANAGGEQNRVNTGAVSVAGLADGKLAAKEDVLSHRK